MKIDNLIGKLKDHKDQKRDWETIQGAMVHRVGIDLIHDVVLGYNAEDVSAAFLGKIPEFSEVAMTTGGQNAYSVMIGGDCGPKEYDGKIWQILALDEIGHHARRFSASYIGIGLIGDFRVKEPSQAQYFSLVDLLAEIVLAFGWDPYKKIKGHGEVEGSHDGSKAAGAANACPGDKLNMFVLRDDVNRLAKEGARRRLNSAGLIFSRFSGT